MTTVTNPPSSPESLTESLDELLSPVRKPDSRRLSWYRAGGLLNARRYHRVAFPKTLHVVGLEKNFDTGQFMPVSKPTIARGRNISVEGISIQHDQPLPHRYVAVSFRSPKGTETLVATFLWCRFTRYGHYVSGGRFTIDPQLNSELNIDWDSLETA